MAIELHFHESIVSFDRGSSSGDASSQNADDSESGGSGGPSKGAVGALIALAVLVGIAYAVRKRRGQTDEEAEIRIDE